MASPLPILIDNINNYINSNPNPFPNSTPIDSSFFNSNPNWLVAAFTGAILGTILTEGVSVFKYASRLVSNKWIYGLWFHYFINLDGKTVHFVEEEVKIKRGYRHPIKFTMVPPTSGKSTYNGYVEFERNFIILKSKSTKEHEQLLQRFKMTAVNDNQFIVGFCLAHDYSGRSSVNPCVISRSKISNARFFEIIKANISAINTIRIMHIK
jgi:hypothetical protein